MQFVANITSTAIMAGLVGVAYASSFKRTRTKSANMNIIDSHSTANQIYQVPANVKMDINGYCALFGYECQEFQIQTSDGFILKVHRIRANNRHSEGNSLKKDLCPVLLMHGLMQSSGVFVTSGINSLAFVLADQGHEVWLGNNRCVEKLHRTLKPSDKEFWEWSLDELAKYDFTALIDYVLTASTSERLIYIGHSQGTSQAFLGLSMNPSISSKIKCFIALAPAVYMGALLQKPPLSMLVNASDETFDSIFGKKEFVSLMNPVQRLFPAKVFASIAYQMFNYLFGWSDENWNSHHKPSYFQFSPRPTSTRALKHWFQVARHGVLKPFNASEKANSATTQSDSCTLSNSRNDFDSAIEMESVDVNSNAKFDFSCVKCPLAVFCGEKDEIVDAQRLIRDASLFDINMLHAEIIDGYEHLDVLWAIDAKDKVFTKILELSSI